VSAPPPTRTLWLGVISGTPIASNSYSPWGSPPSEVPDISHQACKGLDIWYQSPTDSLWLSPGRLATPEWSCWHNCRPAKIEDDPRAFRISWRHSPRKCCCHGQWRQNS